MVPLQVWSLLSGLGFGQKVTVIAALLLFILYLFRGRKAAGSAVSIAGTVWFASVVIGAALIIILFLGWVDPNPSKFLADVKTAAELVWSAITGPVDDWIRTQLSRL